MSATSCTLKAVPTDHGIVIRLEGRGTFRESQPLAEFVTTSLEKGNDSVVVDLDRCSHLDSTFLGCLLILHRKFGMQEPRKFAVTADAAAKQRLLALTRLDAVLDCRETSPESSGDGVDIVATGCDGAIL